MQGSRRSNAILFVQFFLTVKGSVPFLTTSELECLCKNYRLSKIDNPTMSFKCPLSFSGLLIEIGKGGFRNVGVTRQDEDLGQGEELEGLLGFDYSLHRLGQRGGVESFEES